MILPEGVQLAFGTAMYLSGLCWAFFCGDATTSEKVRGKNEADGLMRLKLKFTFFGFIHFLAKVGVFSSLLYEYSYRQNWLRASSKELPNIYLSWIRIILTFLIGIIMPLWVSGICYSFWEKDKNSSKTHQNQVVSLSGFLSFE